MCVLRRGVWTRDIKLSTNIPQHTLTKTLKILEQRNLIKSVRSVVSKSKKLYMLYDIVPAKEITGALSSFKRITQIILYAILPHSTVQYSIILHFLVFFPSFPLLPLFCLLFLFYLFYSCIHLLYFTPFDFALFLYEYKGVLGIQNKNLIMSSLKNSAIS